MQPRQLYTSLLRHPFLRFVVPFFIISGLFLMISPRDWYAEWFFPRLTGIGALIYATILVGLNYFFPVNPESDLETLNRKHRALTRLQNYLAIGFLMGFAGTLGIHEFDFGWDKLTHFFFPCIAMIAISRFMHRWWDISLNRAVAYTILLLIAATIGWEFLEFGSDQIFGTKAFGLRGGKEILYDTLLDSFLDLSGILVGIAAVYLRKKPFPY